MANQSYAVPLLAAGVLGLVATCYLAPSLNPPGSAMAQPAEPQAELIASRPVPPPMPVVEVAATPAPAVVNPEIAGAGREAACQAEFNKVIKENPVDFLRDRNDLSGKGKASIEKLVVVAKACAGMKIEVQGHTDSTGRRQNNIRLSKKRADAVKEYLVALGLSSDRLTAVGFGPDRPVASNRTQSGRDLNRRIEFRVTRVESE